MTRGTGSRGATADLLRSDINNLTTDDTDLFPSGRKTRSGNDLTKRSGQGLFVARSLERKTPSNTSEMAKPSQKKPTGRKGTRPNQKDAARTVSDAIGDRLRQLYDEALNEPVPKELSDLVERLSNRSGKPTT